MLTFAQFITETIVSPAVAAILDVPLLARRGVQVNPNADRSTQLRQLRHEYDFQKQNLVNLRRKGSRTNDQDEYDRVKEEILWLEQTLDYIHIVLTKIEMS